MRKTMPKLLITLVFFVLAFASCKEQSMPKPRGYFRIDLPETTNYLKLEGSLPYQLEYSEHAQIQKVAAAADSFWLDIVYPQVHGKIYLSYKSLEKNNLDLLVEDAHKFVFKHSVKASFIEESPINDDVRQMYGILYDIGGDAASNTQFYITDRKQHFLRAALYFQCPPDRDSLNPVINYVREDILHLLETFKWED